MLVVFERKTEHGVRREDWRRGAHGDSSLPEGSIHVGDLILEVKIGHEARKASPGSPDGRHSWKE